MNQIHLEGFPGSRNSMSNSGKHGQPKEEWLWVMDDGEGLGVRLEMLTRKLPGPAYWDVILKAIGSHRNRKQVSVRIGRTLLRSELL